jgi:ribosomal protein S18 acetylase RimI-like enzyme
MSWRIFQRWFNCPPCSNSKCVTDKYGEKYWIGWFDADSLFVWYRSRPVGKVDFVWENPHKVTLAYIGIDDPKLRGRGLGKAMWNEALLRVKKYGANYISGWIQADEMVSIDYLAEWYTRRGFKVTNNYGKYNIEMSLE